MSATVEKGNNAVILLTNVQQYSPTAGTYSSASPASITLTVVDPTSAVTTLTLAGGTVILSSGTSYYAIVPCTLAGHWRGTWVTTLPNGAQSVEWDVIQTAAGV